MCILDSVCVDVNWSKGFGNENNSQHGFGHVWLWPGNCVIVGVRV